MKTPFSLISFVAMATLTGHASAASIIWGSATNVSSASDISTAGTLVSALDLGSGSDRTINGVTFSAYASVAAGTSGSYDVTGVTGNGSWGNAAFGAYGTPSALASTVYGSALNDGIYTNGVGSTRSQTLTGLLVGQQYQIQIWFNDVRAHANPDSVTFGSGAGNPTVTLLSNDNSPSFSQYAIGTFTANDTTQLLTFQETAGQGGATINMFQLRAIPEPSVAVLGGIGMLALLRRRRVL